MKERVLGLRRANGESLVGADSAGLTGEAAKLNSAPREVNAKVWAEWRGGFVRSA